MGNYPCVCSGVAGMDSVIGNGMCSAHSVYWTFCYKDHWLSYELLHCFVNWGKEGREGGISVTVWHDMIVQAWSNTDGALTFIMSVLIAAKLY